MGRACHVEKSKKSIRLPLRACWIQLLFENVLKFLNSLALQFSGESTVKLPRENKLDKELPELLPLGREMLQTTLSRSFLTAKMRIMTFILRSPLTTLIMLLLICQTLLISWLQRIDSVLPNPCSCIRIH